MVDQDLPISGLPVASPLTGAELSPVVQNGITKFTTLASTIYLPTNNYGLFSQTGSSIPVSGSAVAVKTSGSLVDGGIGSLSIPANGFSKGDSFHASISGKLTIGNNNTLDIRIKAGNIVLADTGEIVMSGTTNKNWNIELDFTIREIGPAGVASIITMGEFTYKKNASAELIGELFSFVNTSSFDTTISNILNIEAVLDDACIASENIYSEMLTLRKTY
jgi:hypothetical protein